MPLNNCCIKRLFNRSESLTKSLFIVDYEDVKFSIAKFSNSSHPIKAWDSIVPFLVNAHAPTKAPVLSKVTYLIWSFISQVFHHLEFHGVDVKFVLGNKKHFDLTKIRSTDYYSVNVLCRCFWYFFRGSSWGVGNKRVSAIRKGRTSVR